MSPARESLARLEAVFTVGLRLARSAPTGVVALAQLSAVLDPAWLPSPAADDFAAVLAEAERATCVAIPTCDVESVLIEAWGTAVSAELDELDPEPVAVTPGAQVHRGVLDGQSVAIKVLRPGLAASVRQDFTLLEALAAPLAAAFPSLDTSAAFREVRERVLEEFDLESEATLQRRFARALRRHPFLSVPVPLTRLCRDRVLVTEWVDGVGFHEAPDPDRAAAQLITFVLGAARWGISYADPHGDNVLVTDDGGLVIVDFGACRSVEAARVQAAVGVLEAVAAEDPHALGTHLEALGWMQARHAPDALALTRAVGGAVLAPGASRLNASEVIAARERLTAHAGELAELLPHGAIAPVDLWPGRGVAQLLATIARLGASGDWVALALSALRDGWSGPAE